MLLQSSTAHGTFAGLFDSAQPNNVSITTGWIRTTAMNALSWRRSCVSFQATAAMLDQKRRLMRASPGTVARPR